MKDANVVAVSQGKEIIVLSAQQAHYLIEHQTEIVRYSHRLKNLARYNPVEIRILHNSVVVGKTLEDIRLWHNTGAAMVAIHRRK